MQISSTNDHLQSRNRTRSLFWDFYNEERALKSKRFVKKKKKERKVRTFFFFCKKQKNGIFWWFIKGLGALKSKRLVIFFPLQSHLFFYFFKSQEGALAPILSLKPLHNNRRSATNNYSIHIFSSLFLFVVDCIKSNECSPPSISLITILHV